jgi:AraC family transcriptional regulator
LGNEIHSGGGRLRGLPPRRFSAAQSSLVEKYIHANLGYELNLFDLANLVRLSPRQFFRIFSNTYRMTPHKYMMNERVARAKELMLRGQRLADIAAALGFTSRSHFSYVFRVATGMSPRRFRQQHRSYR